MDQIQIHKLVEKIEAKIKLFQQDETAQLYGLNEYDAIEVVLREELGTSRPPEPPIVCNVCKAIFVLADNREHLCGLTLPQAYSLGWRRGNNSNG